MIYRIVEYIQPWEIDDLERQVDQLIRGSYYIPNIHTVILDITLNVSIVNWETSKLPKQYFLDKFNYIKSKAEFYFETSFDTDSVIAGCTDKRRSAQNKTQDYIVWLDSDVFFPVTLLPYSIIASESIKEECIISPEIIRYWDSSWDCITAEQFLSEPHNHRDYFDMYSVDEISSNHINLKLNSSGVKFGGGWFNMFSDSIFKKIPLVNELGAYAPDDTYVSICSRRFSIPQYLLSGLIVSELGNKFLKDKDYIKPLLDVKIADKEKISDIQFESLIKDLYGKNNILHTQQI
jgi:hypothetical protein